NHGMKLQLMSGVWAKVCSAHVPTAPMDPEPFVKPDVPYALVMTRSWCIKSWNACSAATTSGSVPRHVARSSVTQAPPHGYGKVIQLSQKRPEMPHCVVFPSPSRNVSFLALSTNWSYVQSGVFHCTGGSVTPARLKWSRLYIIAKRELP